MVLKDFATKAEIIDKRNITVPGLWPIGIDYGYSAVKGFACNKVFCFPNYALKLPEDVQILETNETDLFLREKDQQGNYVIWAIGNKAFDLNTRSDAINFEGEMFGRDRYETPSFQAIIKTGLAIALLNNSAGAYKGETLYIQTGLPPAYRKADTELLKDALAGDYHFSLKIGKKPYQPFDFSVDARNIIIMDQPMGSLYSVLSDNEGKRSPADAVILSHSKSLILDPGFKTLDVFSIESSVVRSSMTFDDLGMYEVFSRTVRELNENYKCNLSVSQMQQVLKRGYATSFDRKERRSCIVQIDQILEKNLKEVCNAALDKVGALHNYLQEYNYLIVTGGTGNAWFDMIRESYRYYETLTILSANRYDPNLSNTYSNVRGYYLFLVNRLERQMRGSGGKR